MKAILLENVRANQKALFPVDDILVIRAGSHLFFRDKRKSAAITLVFKNANVINLRTKGLQISFKEVLS